MPRTFGFRYTRAIYAIKERKSKRVYIGATKRLEREWSKWREAMWCYPKYMERHKFQQGHPDDFDFMVLHVPDKNISDDALNTLKNQLVARAREKGVDVTNPEPRQRHKNTAELNDALIPLWELSQTYGVPYTTIVDRWKRGIRGERLVRKGRVTTALQPLKG